MKLSDLAEHQIRKAQVEGQFDNLKGAGKPLSDQPDGSTDAIGFRMMAEAGALPREIELRKAIEALTQSLPALSNPADRSAALKALADLQLRLDIEQEARRRFQGD